MIICFLFCFNFAFKFNLRRYTTEAHSEARRLRSMMVEAQRERAAAELREADLKRTVQHLGGAAGSGLEVRACTRPLFGST
jgi:hypothetical protein